MKNSNLFNIGTKVFGIVAMMALLMIFSHFAAAATGIIYAIGAPVAGAPVTVQATETGSPELNRDAISKIVTKMRPATTPLDTMLREIDRAVAIKSFKTEYFAVDHRPFYDTVATAYTATGDGQTTYDLVVNNIGMWAADDTCMFYGVAGSDTLDLQCFIISRNVSANTIKIQPLNGPAGSGTTAGEIILPASIPISTRIVRCGAAKNELDAQTSPYAIIPVPAYNYAQIFMAQVEEGWYQSVHEKEVNWSFPDYQAQSIYDMRATIELSYLFGVRALFNDKVNAIQRYTTGGAIRFITKALEYGTGGSDRTIDNSTFVDWNKSIFVGNSGSDTRILLGGDGLMANLMKVDTVLKQIEAKNTQVKFGVTFNEIETNHGKLLFKRHPLFEQAGWTDKGIVLDMNHIEKHTYKPMSTRTLDLKASGQRNVNAVLIEEASALIVRYPDTHAIIAPKA